MQHGRYLLCASLSLVLLFGQAAGCSNLSSIERPDGLIELQLVRSGQSISCSLLVRWINDAANAVAKYYGSIPMRHIVVRVTPVIGTGVGFSTASEEDGYGLLELPVGINTSEKDLKRDWTLTHEMLHLGFPLMKHRYRWLAEGIATYVEPIARLRIGIVSADEVWQDLVDNLPRGQRAAAYGLNQAQSIDGTYWGGALYCLLADIEIRRRTKGRKGLEDALRAILQHNGDITSDWSFDRAIEIGDRATGVPVLRDLYSKMADCAPSVDLNAVWRDLGVDRIGGRVVFNNNAPAAWIRNRIAPASKP